MGDEALDMLTDEERAGLEEPEVDEEALKDIAGEEEGEPEEEVDPPATDPPVDEPKDEPVADPPPVEEEPAAEVVDDVPTMEPPKAPETFDFDAKEDAYAKALTEGDTETAKAIRAEIRSAEKVQAKYEAEVAAFNMIQQDRQNTATATWKREQAEFMADHKEYGSNKILHGALNTAVIELANDPANFTKTGAWILKEAHRQVQEAFGKQPEPKKEAPPSKEKPKSERPKVPTLGALPNAAPEDTGRDEFEHIDALREKDPEAYEEALSKLSPAQQQKYLRG